MPIFKRNNNTALVLRCSEKKPSVGFYDQIEKEFQVKVEFGSPITTIEEIDQIFLEYRFQTSYMVLLIQKNDNPWLIANILQAFQAEYTIFLASVELNDFLPFFGGYKLIDSVHFYHYD